MKKGKILINVNDIIGKCFDKLEVTNYFGNRYSHTRGGERLRHFYMCKCDCGNVHVCSRSALLNGITRSCGCSKQKIKKR